MRRLLLLAAVALTVACASDRTLIGNSAAAYQFHESRYEAGCVAFALRTDCPAFRKDLQLAKAEILRANDVQKIGKMPKAERDAVKNAIAALEAHK